MEICSFFHYNSWRCVDDKFRLHARSVLGARTAAYRCGLLLVMGTALSSLRFYSMPLNGFCTDWSGGNWRRAEANQPPELWPRSRTRNYMGLVGSVLEATGSIVSALVIRVRGSACRAGSAVIGRLVAIVVLRIWIVSDAGEARRRRPPGPGWRMGRGLLRAGLRPAAAPRFGPLKHNGDAAGNVPMTKRSC